MAEEIKAHGNEFFTPIPSEYSSLLSHSPEKCSESLIHIFQEEIVPSTLDPTEFSIPGFPPEAQVPSGKLSMNASF